MAPENAKGNVRCGDVVVGRLRGPPRQPMSDIP